MIIGHSAVDASPLTGESIPVEVTSERCVGRQHQRQRGTPAARGQALHRHRVGAGHPRGGTSPSPSGPGAALRRAVRRRTYISLTGKPVPRHTVNIVIAGQGRAARSVIRYRPNRTQGAVCSSQESDGHVPSWPSAPAAETVSYVSRDSAMLPAVALAWTEPAAPASRPLDLLYGAGRPRRPALVLTACASRHRGP